MEKIKIPESLNDREKIAKVIDGIKFQENFEFEYEGMNHQILLCDKDQESGSPVSFYWSTSIEGFDIYIWDSMPESWKKVAMMHEIKEINLISKKQWKNSEAHWEARKYEDDYGREKLGVEGFREYVEFRSKYDGVEI